MHPQELHSILTIVVTPNDATWFVVTIVASVVLALQIALFTYECVRGPLF